MERARRRYDAQTLVQHDQWLANGGDDAIEISAGDLNFAPALRNTFALVLMVIPVQLVLALTMAMMLQKVRVARDIVLWIWTIPLAVSDLAAGLAWFAILQDSGYLNSFLYAVGAIPDQQAWLSYETPSTLFLGIAAAGATQ